MLRTFVMSIFGKVVVCGLRSHEDAPDAVRGELERDRHPDRARAGDQHGCRILGRPRADTSGPTGGATDSGLRSNSGISRVRHGSSSLSTSWLLTARA
jgi:hypothetical protein